MLPVQFKNKCTVLYSIIFFNIFLYTPMIGSVSEVIINNSKCTGSSTSFLLDCGLSKLLVATKIICAHAVSHYIGMDTGQAGTDLWRRRRRSGRRVAAVWLSSEPYCPLHALPVSSHSQWRCLDGCPVKFRFS